MKKENQETNLIEIDRERLLNVSFSTYDLPLIIKELKDEKTWKRNDRNAITFFKSENMCVVLVILKEGAEMQPHKTNSSINVDVIEGEIKFNTTKEVITLKKNQMLIINEDIKHFLMATEETVLLLTLAGCKVEFWEEQVLFW